MNKLVHIPRYFADTFEPSVQLIDDSYWTGNVKTASEAFDYIKEVKPKPGHRFILVIAMGAGEWWGANKNGDFFPEQDLLKNFKHFETKYNEQNQVNGGALVFKHHKNKLIENHPWFGTVVKAFYNTKMHRVELLLDIHGSKGQDIIDRINNGEDIAVSMGVRIPYDVCSICGNKAKTRENYCDHLKYELGKILPDGRKVYAINGQYDYSTHPKPLNFFDISIVFRPADQTGYMLKKVAEETEEVVSSALLFDKQAAMQDKIAFMKKMSKMDKYMKGMPVAEKDDAGHLKLVKAFEPTLKKMVSNSPVLGPKEVESLSGFPLNKILATLSHNGVILTTPEFMSLVVYKLTGKHIDSEMLYEIADQQGDLFEHLSENPEEMDECEELPAMNFQNLPSDPEVESVLSHFREGRDWTNKGLVKKAMHTDLVRSTLDLHDPQHPWADRKGMLHKETYTDPETGKKFITTQGAIEDAHLWDRHGNLIKAILAAGTLGGLYAYLNSKNSILGPAAGLAAILLGGKVTLDALKSHSEIGKFDSGEAIPAGVVMNEKKGSYDYLSKEAKFKGMKHVFKRAGKKFHKFWHGKKPEKPGIGDKLRDWTDTGRTVAILAPPAAVWGAHNYYKHKAQRGELGVYRDKLDQHMENFGRWAYNHPVLTTGAGVIGSNLALDAVEGLRKVVFRK